MRKQAKGHAQNNSSIIADCINTLALPTTLSFFFYILFIKFSMKRRRISHDTDTGMFADISFLLLIFFMVVTTFNKAYEVQMSLPPLSKSKSSGKLNKQRVLNIFLNDRGQVLVEDQLYDNDFAYSLVAEIERISSHAKPGIVKINMHPNTDYKNYIMLLTRLKQDKELVMGNLAEEMFNKEFNTLHIKQKRLIAKKTKYSVIENEIATL